MYCTIERESFIVSVEVCPVGDGVLEKSCCYCITLRNVKITNARGMMF